MASKNSSTLLLCFLYRTRHQKKGIAW